MFRRLAKACLKLFVAIWLLGFAMLPGAYIGVRLLEDGISGTQLTVIIFATWAVTVYFSIRVYGVLRDMLGKTET